MNKNNRLFNPHHFWTTKRPFVLCPTSFVVLHKSRLTYKKIQIPTLVNKQSLSKEYIIPSCQKTLLDIISLLPLKRDKRLKEEYV